ncbi:hypothetical protein COU76_01115 [Candidatus Peregrinibacteria bacterium CG10_big_fil_rev_8_21_14_0_10_49_10]|nr:MAG: hypothetical protein COU76_01115 [Candidatus Peregrinibacteria bacterium CG10_big_fil_rev_8_21_14_0_10_49_10]
MRLYYFFGTPYGIRGHDTDGHVEYIQYLLDHSFAMPSSGTGWEFYHPPLYYALSAVWMQIHSLFEPLKAALLRGLQVEALLLSIGTYGVICWISSLLFPKRKHRKDRLMFLLVLAVQPSLLYFSARVNNDVLYQLFAFVAFGFLLRWWRDERPRDWYVAIVATGLGILTKSNALLLLPVLYGCLLIRKKMSWDKKLKLGIRGILAILCMCAWFYVVRFGWENNTSLIENTRNLHSGLRVENSIDTLTEFNPLRLILEPYNNAWGGEVRNHFWEYWFLSSLFGEFSFGPVLRPLASALVALALFLLPVLFIGFYRIIRHAWYKTFPLWYSVLVLLAGHIAIRQYEPFSPTQDFRFAVLLLVPAVYSLLIGIRLLPKKRRPLFRGALLLLVALCSLFIVSIPFVRV